MAALPNNNSELSKKNQVEEMFNQISPKYDLLNHLLSANIDKLWRRRVIKRLELFTHNQILDIATGTADFAIAASKLKDAKITGIDISEGMLNVGKKKIEKNKLETRITLLQADSENLPFPDNSFDAVIVGFGVRNFETLKTGLAEIFRVLKPGGVFFVLEFSRPRSAPFKQVYQYYFTQVLPFVGRLVSKSSNAYTYLPESVKEFPDGDDFLSILAEVNFTKSRFFSQTFGIATIYEAHKPK